MPDYLYECPKCGRFSKIQRISAPALENCPDCASPVKRIIVGGNILLKGSGALKGGDWDGKMQVENFHKRKEATD